ncbi:Outer membrane protein assembly factor BamB, contains PQQ-like beta-propeller repeat [Prosthecobacter debontii]|uniref:Outer membrane protein assembly factor BamB, contains PQQ-like beta-propeller repeat n=2 Tax=Prosthecobacter debontii TaxID=48467 RepID=A0A1T4Y8B6_9BACT|nr:Outer membrane protein assembly factor BamB, contains PQQ-like beta-propeller repeat [Prosthecobacter debontii]
MPTDILLFMKTALVLSSLCLATFAVAKSDWSRFRGPNGTGVAEAAGLPTEVTADNTVWSVPLDKGWSSPVLWEDRIFVTAETGAGKHGVISLDAKTGKEVWRYEDVFTEHKKHNFNSFASSSVFVDAERIYINWETGNTIQALALDHQGKLIWKNEHVADYIHEHGTGVSPIVVDGILIVRSEFDWQRDGKIYTEDPTEQTWKSCIVGLNAATGKQVWKLEIPNCLNTYSTPVVNVKADGKKEIICANNASGVMGIDPAQGKINWQYNPGFKQRSLGSGVLHEGVYFCTFGTGGGVKEFAAIDVTGPQPKPVDFAFSKGLPYVPSPLVMGDNMYLLGDGGILKTVKFKTGELIYEERVNGSKGSSKFFSSPVAGDGKIYCGSQQGDLIVIKAGDKFEQLSANKLDSPINASPAIGDGRVYVRTEKMLWCIGAKTPPLP